jgi:hypothetical protein
MCEAFHSALISLPEDSTIAVSTRMPASRIRRSAQSPSTGAGTPPDRRASTSPPDAAITKQWASALAAARQPESTGNALTLAGLDAILSDPEQLAAFRAAATNFQAWLGFQRVPCAGLRHHRFSG